MNYANTDAILDRLLENFQNFSPQLRQAAQYIIDNPNEIGVNSMRRLAAAAAVKPNTLVRLAKALDYDSYESFREPFRDQLRRGTDSFPDRARWLQHIGRGGSHGQIYSQMAASAMNNIESLFSTISADDVKAAADAIIEAKTAYLLGLGSCYALINSLYYVGRMALDNLLIVPQQASLPIDDMARIGPGDVLFSATYHPYRRETVEATRMARRNGAFVIAATDSRTSPIAVKADIAFVVPMSTPQFFPSAVGMIALVEALLAFMVAGSDENAVQKIERFHRQRTESFVYWSEDDED